MLTVSNIPVVQPAVGQVFTSGMVSEAAATAPTILWDALHACNLRCGYCFSQVFQDFDLKPPETDQLFSIAARFAPQFEHGARIYLTGGEPLLIEKIERIVAALNVFGFRVVINTNGTLLTASKARSLSLAGADGIIISVDSIDAKIHDFQRSQHQRTIGNLRRVLQQKDELRFRIGIAATIGEWNVAGVDELFRWCAGEGVGYFMFNVVWGGLNEALGDKSSAVRNGILKLIDLLRADRSEIQKPSAEYLDLLEAALSGQMESAKARIADCLMGEKLFFLTSKGELLRTLKGSHENEDVYRPCQVDFPSCLTFRCLCLWELFYGGL